ncbi:MAG TPA: TIGR03118 family protein [Steroidobacteraceae bacterium]|nr:TIGR03118 family protein [Steroidobacteraceae bacterium]
MTIAQVRFGLALTAAVSLLAACGGGGSSGGASGDTPAATAPPPMMPTPQMGFTVTNLVANKSAIQSQFNAAHVDANLVNPWGIAFNPQGFDWVADAATSVTTLYDGSGVLMAALPGAPLAIPIPKASSPASVSGPTGVVFNTSPGFVLPDGAAANFLFATLDGQIEGWDASQPAAAVSVFTSSSAAMYTALALGTDTSGNNFLYAADFSNNKVDVFDQTFKLMPAGSFVTPQGVPEGFVPYGIQNIKASDGTTQIYVSYAQPDAQQKNGAAIAGAGLGYVAVFDAAGTNGKLLISAGALNAPWGMALAPPGFGNLGGALLVGNFGDGAINAFDPGTGASLGALLQTDGTPVQIPFLWGIAFGNGVNNEPANTLFFAAGLNNQLDGLYGRIDFGGISNSMPAPPTPPTYGGT